MNVNRNITCRRILCLSRSALLAVLGTWFVPVLMSQRCVGAAPADPRSSTPSLSATECIAPEAEEETRLPAAESASRAEEPGDAETVGAESPERPASTETDPATPLRMQAAAGDLESVLSLLAKRGLLDLDDPDVQRNVIRSLLATVGGGAELIPADAADGAGGRRPHDSGEAAGMVSFVLHGTIAYCGVANLTDSAARQLCSDLAAREETGSPASLVLDLRWAGGIGGTSAQQAARCLNSIEIPMVVLLNGETAGSAELLALQLTERSETTLLGQPTSGCPYTFRIHQLPSGARVKLPNPDTPGAGRRWPPAPVVPDIVQEGRISRQELRDAWRDGTLAESVDNDRALQRAVDLLITVSAFR